MNVLESILTVVEESTPVDSGFGTHELCIPFSSLDFDVYIIKIFVKLLKKQHLLKYHAAPPNTSKPFYVDSIGLGNFLLSLLDASPLFPLFFEIESKFLWNLIKTTV